MGVNKMKKNMLFRLVKIFLLMITFLITTATFVFAKDPVSKDCSELSGCSGNYGCAAYDWHPSPDCYIECSVGIRYCPDGTKSPPG